MSTTPVIRPPETDNPALELRHVAAVALAVTGVAQLTLIADYFEQSAAYGWLLLIAAFVSLTDAAWLWVRDEVRAWWTGVVVGIALPLGFVLSHTVGALGYQESDLGLTAVIALVAELVVLGAFAWDRWVGRDTV